VRNEVQENHISIADPRIKSRAFMNVSHFTTKLTHCL